MSRPIKGTYPEYYDHYLSLVKNNDVIEALLENEKDTLSFFNGIPSQLANHAYSEGKWTIKEIINHITDCERIFCYRALRFARKDEQQVLSFDHDNYVKNAELEHRSLQDLIEEYASVRKASISLFKSFGQSALDRSGNTAAGKITVNTLGFAICGHANHHINILKERYLIN